ncbi:MAG: aminoacyl-tRNA hydrolase [Candidatus Marinimicrobia bacterium]|nr:aminoacyl-tRNA hydrolase [Candidatus Neomarinimicrobiota bacterium]MBT3576847.1 aminoacyl-tRNA hydrolase [Candidatus Neomarinimicrobiota bacterium]MBT3679055.1 aminoacyl-tRNA hydrolase [Candidatus Neomarinimicrobiota bacterium]MBT3950312.1 aminoacyl-tRNA hydrolase [Candidatus Neomarinimicrobiota bacterium]MBT4252074.1 aminoacyl-tRNA hydrolase [Candidatus Neomarinimicrobiota bacterium]
MLRAIIGLGNPGSRYVKTRHNAGFMVIDELAQRWQVSFKPGKGNYVFAKSATRDAILMKPTTYMNNSGQAVRHLTDYFKIEVEDCMIVFDDLDILFPELRLRKQGGAGTHRGMQSVIQHLNETNFPRTRMGIGGDQGRRLSEDFVLENYSKDDLNVLPEQLGKAADALEYWLKDDIDNTMNRFNIKPRKAQAEDLEEEN